MLLFLSSRRHHSLTPASLHEAAHTYIYIIAHDDADVVVVEESTKSTTAENTSTSGQNDNEE